MVFYVGIDNDGNPFVEFEGEVVETGDRSDSAWNAWTNNNILPAPIWPDGRPYVVVCPD